VNGETTGIPFTGIIAVRRPSSTGTAVCSHGNESHPRPDMLRHSIRRAAELAYRPRCPDNPVLRHTIVAIEYSGSSQSNSARHSAACIGIAGKRSRSAHWNVRLGITQQCFRPAVPRHTTAPRGLRYQASALTTSPGRRLRNGSPPMLQTNSHALSLLARNHLRYRTHRAVKSANALDPSLRWWSDRGCESRRRPVTLKVGASHLKKALIGGNRLLVQVVLFGKRALSTVLNSQSLIFTYRSILEGDHVQDTSIPGSRMTLGAIGASSDQTQVPADRQSNTDLSNQLVSRRPGGEL